MKLYSKTRQVFLLSMFIATSFSLLLVSCKSNSTSLEDPEEPNNFEVCGDTLKDNDGNSYKTVQIGNQCWTAQDLRTASYQDGSSIPNVTEDIEWTGLTNGAWAYYANDDLNSDINGKLYNWFAATDSRGICPTGWKVPSDDNWKALEIELGMTEEEANSEEWRGDNKNIGGKMKDINSWSGENVTNESGFSAIPAGSRTNNGTFSASYSATWWSSSELNENTAWQRLLFNDHNHVYRGSSTKSFGFPIRCMLD